MYGKYFASTFSGSMVGAGPVVFAVWGYVIANTVDSQVELNPRLLAAVIGTDAGEVVKALEYLCAADGNSRSEEHGGRRLLKEGSFAYRVVNHQTYRTIRNEDERREYNRVKQREFRAKKATQGNKGAAEGTVKEEPAQKRASKQVSMTVIDKYAVSAHTEADTDTEEECTPFGGTTSKGGGGEGPPKEENGGVGGDGGDPNKPDEYGRQLPTLEWCLNWVAGARANGADYTDDEVRKAFPSLAANGWMWGKHPVTDYRHALESRINDRRDKLAPREPQEKVNPRNVGVY